MAAGPASAADREGQERRHTDAASSFTFNRTAIAGVEPAGRNP